MYIIIIIHELYKLHHQQDYLAMNYVYACMHGYTVLSASEYDVNSVNPCINGLMVIV